MNRKILDCINDTEVLYYAPPTITDLEKFALYIIEKCVEAIDDGSHVGDFSDRAMGRRQARDSIRKYWSDKNV
jgi:hypothetical protein